MMPKPRSGFTVHLDTATLEKLKRVAAQQDRRPGELARVLIRDGLNVLALRDAPPSDPAGLGSWGTTEKHVPWDRLDGEHPELCGRCLLPKDHPVHLPGPAAAPT